MVADCGVAGVSVFVKRAYIVWSQRFSPGCGQSERPMDIVWARRRMIRSMKS